MVQQALDIEETYRRRSPLAERLRPTRWEDFEGVSGLDRNLIEQLKEGRGRAPSLILWGPPGVGKTTFAKLVGSTFPAKFVQFSAVLSGVKDVREVVEEAKRSSAPTVLFVDEIHRFNKAQQDAFLPHVESGTISLIGATTENPSFYMTSALMSRCKVVVFPDLMTDSLERIIFRGEAELGISLSPEARSVFFEFCGGDARKLLNLFEAFSDSIPVGRANGDIDRATVLEFFSSSNALFYDRQGEEHYNIVSAFIKSLRGSNPDAALYWGFRMIESGEDPRFVIRRMMIFASEDIGNADPRALQVAVATSDAFEKLGIPEGLIPIAQCITYLATAPKSNRSYEAMNKALEAVKKSPKVSVPLHLRNAPTGLMKELGYGKEYLYPHDHADATVHGINYFPDGMAPERFYEPSDRGYEKMISERLKFYRGES